MPVVYRPMLPHDEHAVLTLWADVFNIPYDYERARLLSDPQRYGTTFVAVDTDGAVLSTAHYRVHARRDRDGTPRRVGELDPVATRPEAQRQGHATRLLELALAAMQQDRCDWSLLATSDAGRSLYAHFEYTPFPIRYRRGALNSAVTEAPHPYQIHTMSLQDLRSAWYLFHALYASYNAQRPLTVVRDKAYWETFTAVRVYHRIEHEQLHVFVASTNDGDRQPCGYIMAHFFDFAFLVIEMSVHPDHQDTISALLATVGDEAKKRGLIYGEVDVPYEQPIDRAVAQLFGTTLHLSDENTRIMARPIGASFSQEQLAALFSAPAAFYAVLDHF